MWPSVTNQATSSTRESTSLATSGSPITGADRMNLSSVVSSPEVRMRMSEYPRLPSDRLTLLLTGHRWFMVVKEECLPPISTESIS